MPKFIVVYIPGDEEANMLIRTGGMHPNDADKWRVDLDSFNNVNIFDIEEAEDVIASIRDQGGEAELAILCN